MSARIYRTVAVIYWCGKKIMLLEAAPVWREADQLQVGLVQVI